MTKKLQLLFISPTIPSMQGGGMKMRAYEIIEALKKKYDVHVYVFPPNKDLFVLLRRLFYKISPGLLGKVSSVPREWTQYSNFSLRKRMRRLLEDEEFDVIHVFRIYMVPLIKKYLEDPNYQPSINLDLDDIESKKILGYQEIASKRGDSKRSQAMMLEAKKYQDIESKYITKFDRVFVCSENDKNILSNYLNPDRIQIIPNTIRLPKRSIKTSTNSCFTYLFVGSFNYFPNRDGVSYFCTDILPLINSRTNIRFEFRIIGFGGSFLFRKQLRKIDNVNFLGYIDDLSSHYHDADVIVIPIRCGGGTRIKILEAFAYAKPTVSTSIGTEGINIKNKEHILIADSSEDFADACIKLLSEPDLRTYLGENAFELVKTRYSYDILRNIIKTL